MPARHRPVATLATVAAAAGVSRQTVSNALNSPDLLRPDTLERVQRAIDRLGYTPNRAARNLRTRTSHLVGPAAGPRGRGYGERADGPVPALARRVVQGGRPPRAAVHRRGRQRPARRLRRAAALRCGRRLRGHRHLPGQPAGGLARGAAGAVRGLRPPLGGPAGVLPLGGRRRPRRGDARRRPPRRPGARADRLGRVAEVVVHRRGPAQRLARPDARARPVHHPAQRPWRGHHRVRAPGRARAPRQRVAHGVRRA